MVFKIFLLTLSFTNIQLFWIIKLPHILAVALFLKYKIWLSKIPHEVFFLYVAMIFMTASTVVNPSVQYWSDLVGLSVCGFLYILSYALASKLYSQEFLTECIFNSVFYCSVIALSFYAIEFYFTVDIRGSFGLKREISSMYFGVLRNYGLSTEPGAFAYYYVALAGFLSLYTINNMSAFTLIKVLVISVSFVLTFSAGALGILSGALFLTGIYSFGSLSVKKLMLLSSCTAAVVWFANSMPIDFLAPILGKLSLSTDYASSNNRLDAYLFGLSKLSIDKPFGYGAGYIETYYDHSLFNWFLTLTVQYGYMVLVCVGCFFACVLARLKGIAAEFRAFYVFSIISILGILNIVGVYHSVVYWVVLGSVSGLGSRRNV